MANLTYRQAIQQAPAGTTTKNASLTSQEIDGNFKSLNDELITKAPLVSPGLSGVPTAPTATAGTNTTQLATTAFVQTGLSSRQPLDATLTALSGVSTAANQLIYSTASDTFSTTSITSFGRSLIDDTDAPTARTTLGLGTAAVQSDDRYTHRSNNLSDLANVATARSNLGLGNVDNTSDVNKSVASAAQLTTARSINGTNFNGTGNITTNSWGTSRTITIGSTGKSVNGSADASWSLTEIGAAAASHTHDASAIISGVINIARLPVASTTAQGVVQLSSAVNSTSTVQAATASAVKAAYDAAMSDDSFLKSASGYVKLRSGIIIQWGTNIASDPGTTVTFPIAFPSACISVTATYAQTGDKISMAAHTLTTTTFRLYGWNYSAYWIAIGY
jgi:hypothetical protein